MKCILALDMASHCGWAFQSATGEISSGVSVFLETLHPGARWDRFTEWLGTNLADLVVYEEPIVHFKHRNGLGLGYGFEAVLQLHCHRNGIRAHGVNVSRLKKWATGHGNADKALMLRFAASMGWTMTDDNEVDARWLLEYARERIVKNRAAA